MPTPSWDFVIIILFIMISAYGIINKNKTLLLLASTYIALVVTNVWGEAVYKILTGQSILFGQIWLKGNINPLMVKAGVFFLILSLLSMKGSLKKGITASHWIFILSLLNGCLVVASLISFLDPTAQTAIIAQSKIANFIFSHYSWWVVLPPVILIVASWGASERTTSKKASFRVYRRRR